MRASNPLQQKDRRAAADSVAQTDVQNNQAVGDLARLAAEVCELPAAVITLIDGDRHWIECAYGLDLSKTPIDADFCVDAISGPDPFVVTDASPDRLFSGKPTPAGDNTIRFYAGAPLINSDGSVAGALCVLDFRPRTVSAAQISWLEILSRQVSILLDRHRAAAQLASARQAAEAATVAKSAFLANISHEIRTPMAAIMGYADLMLDPHQSPADRRECLHAIRHNSEHLLKMIGDVLDLAKLESGRMTVEKSDCDLAVLLAETASLMRPRASAKDLDFQLALDGAPPRHIRTDTPRLRQIILNLVGNAIKFTQKGKVVVRIGHDVNEQGRGTLVVDVADTGIGMTPQQVQDLFGKFTQADSSPSRKFSGSGLGLSIGRRLAKMLGGDISVQSVPNQGSIFSLKIDSGTKDAHRGQCDLAAVESCEPVEPQSPRPLPTLSGKILIAEDGRDNQRLLRAILSQAGADVTLTDNGRDAVRFALQGDFRAVLMDMQMPQLDGYEATSELRRSGYTRPIIALTAHAMSDDREKCIMAGCDDYLAKPVEKIDLLETLSAHMQSSAARQLHASSHPSSKPAKAAETDRLVSSYADDPDLIGPLQQFVEELPAQALKLRKYLEESDLEPLRVAVHQLKGSGGGYGFEEITRMAAAAEKSIKAGDALDQVKSAVDALLATLQRVDGFAVSESNND